MSRDQFLWVEKYRPKTIEECILPSENKQAFADMLAKGEIQNLLLSGTAGIGKTTVAKALCAQMGVDCMVINASEESGIDVLRTKIKQFASTVSLNGGVKVIILDEADYLNAQSTQPALRGFIEEFSANCRFIFTCNFKNRLIEAIHSRCTCIDFRIPNKEKPVMAGALLKRVKSILNMEGVECSDDKVLAQLIMKHFPDLRRTLNELQKYSVSGKIDVGILTAAADLQVKDLVKAMKDKDFGQVRKWVVTNIDNDPAHVFRKLYDSMYDHFAPASIPATVLILADYQYKSAFVVDQEINLVAALTEIMMECEFK